MPVITASGTASGTATMTDSPAIIEMAGVSKSFGGFRALDCVDLRVAAAEKVVICGPSGSGKSTLIRCISQLERHEQGRIIVDGREGSRFCWQAAVPAPSAKRATNSACLVIRIAPKIRHRRA